jgi:hypothetical protein
MTSRDFDMQSWRHDDMNCFLASIDITACFYFWHANGTRLQIPTRADSVWSVPDLGTLNHSGASSGVLTALLELTCLGRLPW